MIPLRYLSYDSDTGCRIGGAGPSGLESQFGDPATQYFGTFPLFNWLEREFSVFHRFDPKGTDEARDLISYNNRILQSCPLIWVIVHAKSMRSEMSPNMFEARALQLESTAPEKHRDGNGRIEPYSGCKLGGECFVRRHQVGGAVQELGASGFAHLLQIGEVGADFIQGFPWDPGFLNVWAKVPDDASTYRFCIQQ